MQNRKLDKKEVFYFFFYFILIFNLFFILPYGVKKTLDLNSKINNLKSSIFQFNQDIDFKDRFIAERERIRENILNLKSKIISSQDISTISAYLSLKAKENAVDIQEILPREIQPYKTTSEGNFFYLPLKIEAKARFHNLAHFFNALEKGHYLLEIKELIIKEASFYHKVSIVVCALLQK